MEFKSPSQRPLVVSILLGCLLVAAAIAFAVVWIKAHKDDENCPCHLKPGSESSAQVKYKSGNGKYTYAAVASESKVCSQIGNDILARHRGHAVDAMVATLLCNGVEHPQSSGIGGGAFFVIYDKDKGIDAVDARETAPSAATSDMFAAEDKRIDSTMGGKAVAIPGELKGLLEIHKKYGRVDWKTLVQPSVNLLKNGFVLSKPLYDAVSRLKGKPGFEHYRDTDGNVLPVGSIVKNPKLAATMEKIANDPASFYMGTIGNDIAADIQEANGIITLNDLKNYTVHWTNATKTCLPNNMTVYSMPPPGSGAILSYILSILAGYDFSADSVADEESAILTYHRIVEAMKFAFGKRSRLGDAAFVDVDGLVMNLTCPMFGEATRKKINDDKTQPFEYYDSDFYSPQTAGTNHLSVMDVDGNAVAVTSTVNLSLGSKVVGKRTGIVFNNEMDDFSTPNVTNALGILPSEANFIVPGKRPQSSMSPAIVYDNSLDKVVMVVGAGGGPRITSTTALLIMDVLWFKMPMAQAMDLPRIHHQLLPDKLFIEKELSMGLQDGLRKKGHRIEERTSVMSIAHGISQRNGIIEAASDFRKGGQPAGY